MPVATANGTRKKILIVDDHPMLRKGLTEVIHADGHYEVVGEASNLGDAYKLVGQVSPDVAIVDISLEGNNGIELMKDLNRRWPDLPIVAYSMHDEQIYAERVLRAGAKGYVMKQRPAEDLLAAIKQVLKGKLYLSEAMSDRLLGRLLGSPAPQEAIKSPIDKLSDRELEVLTLIGKGNTTASIAEQLCLSVKTIETYREHLKSKLNLKNGPELTRYAIEWSLSQNS
jgi:DNA-binding NarL/FixJ family response regulator